MRLGLGAGAWSLAALVATVNAACINFHPPPPPIPPSRAGDAPAEAWERGTARGVSAPMVVTGGRVILASANRHLMAVSLDSARTLWDQHLPGDGGSGVLLDGDLLLVGTGRPGGKVMAVTPDGHARWRTSTGNVTAPLGVADGLVLAMTDDGEVAALDRRSGHLRWRRFVGPSRTAPRAAGRGHILVATLDSLLLLRSDSGIVTARRTTPGVVLGGWIEAGSWLVGGSTDSAVVALDAGSLATAWRVHVDAPVTGPIAASADTIWAATRIGSLYRIVQGAATRIARLDWPLTSGVTIVGQDLVVGGADGAIRGLARDGSERWRVRVWPAVDVSPVELPDGFVAVGGDGDLHRFTR